MVLLTQGKCTALFLFGTPFLGSVPLAKRFFLLEKKGRKGREKRMLLWGLNFCWNGRGPWIKARYS